MPIIPNSVKQINMVKNDQEIIRCFAHAMITANNMVITFQ